MSQNNELMNKFQLEEVRRAEEEIAQARKRVQELESKLGGLGNDQIEEARRIDNEVAEVYKVIEAMDVKDKLRREQQEN